MNLRRIAMMVILLLMVLALLGCESLMVPLIDSIDTPQPYAAAQSTLEYGQSQLEELSHQATMVGMDIAQAANAAQQATLDYKERQMVELAYQATSVSLNMAQAAATQQFITEQTQMVWNATANAQSQAATATYSANIFYVTQTALAQAILDLHAAETAQAVAVTQQFITQQNQMVWNATATAQSQAATETYSAYIFNITQTAQAQAILDFQAINAEQVNATQTAYSLTATPFAAIQADIVRTRDESERQAWWDEFVFTPLKVILIILVVILLIVAGVMTYQRLMPVLELRLRTIISRDNESPLLLVDGMIVDPDPPHHRLTPRELGLLKHARFPSAETPKVEIISPSEPSVTNWISEAEQKLRADGWMI